MNNNISVPIADDNEDLAKELSSYIGAKPNMTVTAIATDGEEAYTLISQTRPDVIILDLVMPKLDGIGVLKRMQTLTFDKKPKIIVYSVSSIAIKMAASVSPLIDYCLLKPQSNERDIIIFFFYPPFAIMHYNSFNIFIVTDIQIFC